MSIAIPVTEDRGIDSPVNEHFGSAPLFAIVDQDSGACRIVPNRDRHHSHGTCHPLASLASLGVDSVAVGGIGAGAVGKLEAAGIRVYVSEQPTVEGVVTALNSGTLRRADPAAACAHHGHGRADCVSRA